MYDEDDYEGGSPRHSGDESDSDSDGRALDEEARELDDSGGADSDPELDSDGEPVPKKTADPASPPPTPTDPAALLLAAHAALPPAKFRALLASAISPIVTTSSPNPELCKQIHDVILRHAAEAAFTQHIALAANKASLSLQVDHLAKRVRENWKHGYDLHESLMNKISKECREWMAKLYECGIIRGLQCRQVFLCLRVIDETIDGCLATNARVNFEELPLTQSKFYLISNANKKPRYTSHKLRVIVIQMMRDLALRSLVAGDDRTLAREIVLFIEEKKYSDDFVKFLRTKSVPERAVAPAPSPNVWRRDFFNDSWHPKSFDDAVPILRDILFESRLAAFQTSPTRTLYHQILLASPDRRPSLDSAVHDALFDNLPSPHQYIRNPDKQAKELYALGVVVFAATADEKALDLMCQVTQNHMHEWDRIINHDATWALARLSVDGRAKALAWAKKAIQRMLMIFWRELGDCVADLHRLLEDVGALGDDDDEYEEEGPMDELVEAHMGSGRYYGDGGYTRDEIRNEILGIQKLIEGWPNEAEKAVLYEEGRTPMYRSEDTMVLLTNRSLAEEIMNGTEYEVKMQHVTRAIPPFIVTFSPNEQLKAKMQSKMAA